MDDRDGLSALIDRIVRDAAITSARERAELRRELESHFADAGDSMDRFGDPALVSAELGQAHHRSRFVVHLLRLGLAALASATAALVLQLIANLRVGGHAGGFGLGAGFARSVAFSGMIIIVLVAAWEFDIESLCARLERHPVRMLSLLVGLAGAMILFHAAESTVLPPPGLALAASAVDVIVWTCTIAILARTDRVFARVFAAPPPTQL